MRHRSSLSQRARRLLRVGDAGREPPADPRVLREMIAGQGLEASPPLLAFEARLGGRTLAWADNEVVLGVGRMADEVGDLHAGPDSTRVLVGRQDPWTAISMSPDGRLWSHGPDDAPWELAASGPSYVEQLARRAAASEWCADPFRILLDPDGPAVAAILDLELDEDASDEIEAAWSGAGCWLIQRLRGDPYATSFADLLCRDLATANGILRALHRARPDTRVRAIGTGNTTEEVHRGGYAAAGDVPDSAAWAQAGSPGLAFLGSCLAYLGAPDDEGVVWLLEGPDGSRLEQLVRPGADPGAGFVEWSSFSADRAIRRLYLPVEEPR